jgi:5-methylcytosine-specific restriction protein B
MNNKINQLKKEWDKWSKSWNSKEEYEGFIKNYPKENLENLTLEKYTNIKTIDSDEYFTHWLERKTENCGKFRTASSYAYGIYKVNPNNIQDEAEKKNAENKYKAYDENMKKSKDYLDENKAKKYFEETVRPIIVALANYADVGDNHGMVKTIRPLDINYARKIAYMYNVDKLIPIFKKEVIESIAEFFGIKEEVDFSSYKATEPILTKIKEEFEIKDKIDIQSSQKLASFLWEKFGTSVSFESKNIIYYGAPGTGKTYTVQNAVKQKMLLENAKSFFTQFHPSFGYEDFIEGLKPAIKNGATELVLTDGIFKKFCKDAMEELKMAREEKREPINYYFLADEINRAELSSVFGELLLCIEESKRVDFDENGNILDGSMLIGTQYSYLYQNENDAVIVHNGEYKFGVPSNLYFLGTMNDIDRSIDSFDLALRRRFIWERMDCNYDAILNDEKFKDANEEDLKRYITVCENLNDFIANTLGLGKSYEIGHSYFMNIQIPTKGQNANKITPNNVEMLFTKKLKPLIEEYLRGEYSQADIEKELDKAQMIFKLK